jgi:predicted dehydrogenase
VTLRIGLLGASGIAPLALIDPARDVSAVEVTAVAARDPDRARDFAAEHGIPNVASSYEALLARADVDLVYISLPITLHERWGIASLQAGKHVLMEKPSAPSSAAAARMIAAAARSNRRLIEAFHYRYHPLFKRIIEIVRTRVLGDLLEAHAVIDVPVPQQPGQIRWRSDLAGGALMDLGCYPVHWLRTLAGSFAVTGATIEMSPTGVDQVVRANLRHVSGARGSLFCSMVPHDRGRTTTLHLVGTTGELFVRNPIAPQLGHELRWRSGEGDWRIEPVATTSSYYHQLLAVVDAIRSGVSLPTEGDDLLENLAAIESIYAAAGVGGYAE